MRDGSRYDVVVIGSGFGGSISAMRAASVGKTVLVLERGMRYLPGEFPRDVTLTKRLLWRYPTHPGYRGLYDVRFFTALGAVVASGVGGGSLIYANILIRPEPSVFDNPRWPRSINGSTLSRQYDKVAETLGIAPLPADKHVPKREQLHRAAQQTGHPVFDPDQAVNWGNSTMSGTGTCQLVAQCEFGCPHGAKRSLDLTYLRRAEEHGATVRPNSYVESISPLEHGYRVGYRDTRTGAIFQAVGSRVVVAAGTLGTNELLLRCRDVYRALPALSSCLGQGYSANGDFLGSIQNSKRPLDPWYGPDVTSVIKYFDHEPRFTLAAPTFSKPVMEVLTALGQGDGGFLRYVGPLFYPLLNTILPLLLSLGAFSKPLHLPGVSPRDPSRTTMLFAIGQDTANGRLRLKQNTLDIVWDYARENSALIVRMNDAMREIAAFYGGSFAPILTWSLCQRITTVHSLGGCHMSDSPETGVVSTSGEVYGYPGLFIADGSVIPSSIGFHPAMTIAAISEHIAEALIN